MHKTNLMVTPETTNKIDLFNVLQDLLANYYGAHTKPLANFDFPIATSKELLEALSVLQSENYTTIGDGIFPEDYQDVRLQLVEHLQTQNNLAIARIDQDTIDIVAVLFEFLINDPSIPKALKKLIAPLQIPLLKVAILDKTFFNESTHPARNLINKLAQAAAGWFDDGDRSTKSLYGHIAFIVQQVILGFETECEIFTDLSEEFSAYLKREQLGAELTEQRTTEITKGKEHLWQAKEQVTTALTQRLSKFQAMPLVVQTLIEEGWKNVLLLTYLRYGTKSQQWQQQLAVVDQLIWSVQPKVNNEQRQTLLRLIPDLLRQLTEGLNGISYDQYRMTQLINELQSCHIDCLRVKDCSQSRLLNPEKSIKPKLTHNSQLSLSNNTNKIQTTNQILQLVKNLQIGTWIEVTQDDGRQVRVKLSWKSEVSDIYVFVNHKGKKVLEMTTKGVTKMLQQNQAILLHDLDIPIMERAISALLVNLGALSKYSARDISAS